jgi:hypothetical protein
MLRMTGFATELDSGLDRLPFGLTAALTPPDGPRVLRRHRTGIACLPTI